MTKRSRSITVSVDRIEGPRAVMEAEDGRSFIVAVRSLTERPREGLIYHVPLDDDGEPLWSDATADSAATEARKKDLGERMKRMRDGDDGGDLKL